MKNLSMIVAAAGMLACVAAGAKVPAALLGEPAAPRLAQRTVVIKPTTRYVNVTEGDVVSFVAHGKTFAFNFDSHAVSSFKLNRVAPADALDHTVMVYIARNVNTEN